MKTNPKSFLKIAHVSKVHGLKGEIFVSPLNSRADWPDSIKEIKVGDSVFPVLQRRRHKKGVIFKLEGCDSRSSALALKGQAVFLAKELFRSKKGEGIYLSELMDFCVEFSHSKELGRVQSFQSHSDQDFLLIYLEKQKKEVLVPFVKSYIREICFPEKKLTLNLPENFLEIFHAE